MAAYKLLADNVLTLAAGWVRRTADGMIIPPDDKNADYQTYLAWRAEGNTPDPADPPPLVYARQQAIAARIRTTDATPQEVYRAPLAAMTGYRALLTLLAVDAGNGAVKMVYASLVAKRLGAGAVLVGGPVVLASHQDTAAAPWTMSAAASGNDVVITVTGAAGRSIDWLLDGSVVSFTPGGA